MKNKLSFNSSAKTKKFTVDDIGKLSINDVKQLKHLFEKPKIKRTKKYIIKSYDNIGESESGNTGNEDDDEDEEDESNNKRQYAPFFRGNNINTPFLINDSDRFANKSNLSIEDVNTAFKNNMNPLLDTLRNENRNTLMDVFKPRLDIFDNNMSQMQNVVNDYHNRFEAFDNNLRDVVEDTQQPIIDIFDDDAGNFGGTAGSDHFVTQNDKSEYMETLAFPDQNDVYDDAPEAKVDDAPPVFDVPEENVNDAPPVQEEEKVLTKEELKQIRREKKMKKKLAQYENEIKNHKRLLKNELVQLYINLGGSQDDITDEEDKLLTAPAIRLQLKSLLKNNYNYELK